MKGRKIGRRMEGIEMPQREGEVKEKRPGEEKMCGSLGGTNAARPREGTVKLWRMCTRHQGGLDSVKTCFLASISLYHQHHEYNIYTYIHSHIYMYRCTIYV